MQYIEKTPFEPPLWGSWCQTETRVTLYSNLGGDGLRSMKQFLLQEQFGLCAYCQRERNVSDSSIEHVTPNSSNPNLSTHYHNLVAVCKDSTKDAAGRKHCDKERGNKLLPPLIFYREAQVTAESFHGFLDAQWTGEVFPRTTDPNNPLHKQVSAFIEVLHLNHTVLVSKRREAMEKLEAEAIDKDQTYWPTVFERILRDRQQPFRQFLLILIKKKLQ
jgi:uncharacterized protein (TIGR02646 family)